MANARTILLTIAILTGVGGIIYLLYKYFVEPGSLIMGLYKKILEDIYTEEKTFLYQNAKLDPPIYGLTEAQKAIISAKEKRAEDLEPSVMEIVHERGENITDVFTNIALAIIVASAAPAVIVALSQLLRDWRAKPESSQMMSSYGHSYVIHELVANEMALTGNLNIASGHLQTIQSLYAAYSEPALNVAMSYYQSILPTLMPGTIEYLIISQLINYMTFEVAPTGIMGILWQFWYPIPLL